MRNHRLPAWWTRSKQAVRSSWKFAGAMRHILNGWLTVVFVFPALSDAQKKERIQAWAIALLGRLAIKVIVIGRPPTRGPLMLVANHISWLDVYVIHAACHCCFVAKDEVRRWPLIGTLAVAVGTLFIQRTSRRDALRVVHNMADRLRAGDLLAVFPEGTSSDGSGVLPFHANLFQAAITARAPVQPVALQYLDAASAMHSRAPCYVDKDTLLGSLWRTLNAPPLCAVLTFGELQVAQGRARRAWAADLHTTVRFLRA